MPILIGMALERSCDDRSSELDRQPFTGGNCHVQYVLSMCVKILFTLTCCLLAPLLK